MPLSPRSLVAATGSSSGRRSWSTSSGTPTRSAHTSTPARCGFLMLSSLFGGGMLRAAAACCLAQCGLLAGMTSHGCGCSWVDAALTLFQAGPPAPSMARAFLSKLPAALRAHLPCLSVLMGHYNLGHYNPVQCGTRCEHAPSACCDGPSAQLNAQARLHTRHKRRTLARHKIQYYK